MNRLPTNHAMILGNVNLEFNTKKYHIQHHLTPKLNGVHPYFSNYYYHHYDYNIKWGKCLF